MQDYFPKRPYFYSPLNCYKNLNAPLLLGVVRPPYVCCAPQPSLAAVTTGP